MSTTAYTENVNLCKNNAAQSKPKKLKDIILPSAAGGLSTAAIKTLLLPDEVKGVLKCAKYSEDTFIKKANTSAIETIKNTGKNINLEEVSANAKQLHKELVSAAKPVYSSIFKTFIGMTAAIACAKILSNVILDKKINKED